MSSSVYRPNAGAPLHHQAPSEHQQPEDKTTTKQQQQHHDEMNNLGESIEANMCLELALEGERLCKSGDTRAGIAFFQAAIQAGTDDLRTLSAIYSQLGNAYFYLGEYATAVQFHKHDLTLARSIGDKLGEAKSSGNLGNTFKVMGKFDEALICCKRHLEISREIADKLTEARALYNLGNVYHAKGKQKCRLDRQGPGELSEDVKRCLQQAITHYRDNLDLMRELGDSAGQGRACGNLGNTHYLLGDFQRAIYYHTERLRIARDFGDKAAERRANSNLGNSHIFLGEFEKAALHYRRTLVLAQELEDEALEAQACYSLGNTYTLLHDYPLAIEYHLRHFLIAQKLNDKVGEGRACWSLGNAYSAVGNHQEALNYAKSHLQITQEIGDSVGQATAQINIEELQRVLQLGDQLSVQQQPNSDLVNNDIVNDNVDRVKKTTNENYRLRRPSMDNLSLLKLTPDSKANNTNNKNQNHQSSKNINKLSSQNSEQKDEESFFDLLERFQSTRMDDQRCELKSNPNKPKTAKKGSIKEAKESDKDELCNIVARSQSGRMNEQRVSLPYLPGLNYNSKKSSKSSTSNTTANKEHKSDNDNVEDSFIEMLVRFQDNTRMDDQRSVLPNYCSDSKQVKFKESDVEENNAFGSTVPEDDLFNLVQKVQAARMEDQRAVAPQDL